MPVTVSPAPISPVPTSACGTAPHPPSAGTPSSPTNPMSTAPHAVTSELDPVYVAVTGTIQYSVPSGGGVLTSSCASTSAVAS